MILRLRLRRLLQSRLSRAVILLTATWIAIEVLTIRHALRRAASFPPPSFNDERIFIASIHWTDERILRDYWIQAVAQLAKDIGPANVFVSIYESGSLDNTKARLQTK